MASNTIRHPKKRAFLAAFAECGTVRGAAESAKINRSTHYQWLRDDAVYAEAFERTHNDFADMLEEEATRRAVHGIERIRTHFHKGEIVGQDIETRYSDSLMIFLLKGLRPDKYRENVKLDAQHGGEVVFRVVYDDDRHPPAETAPEAGGVRRQPGQAPGDRRRPARRQDGRDEHPGCPTRA